MVSRKSSKAQSAFDYLLTFGAALLVVIITVLIVKGFATGETQQTIRSSGLNLGLLSDPAYAVPVQLSATAFIAGEGHNVPCANTSEVIECQPVHIVNDGPSARRLTVVSYTDGATVCDEVVKPGSKTVLDLRSQPVPPGYGPNECYAYYWDGDAANNASWSLGSRSACAGFEIRPPVYLDALPERLKLGDVVSFGYSVGYLGGLANATLYTNEGGVWSAKEVDYAVESGANFFSYNVSESGTFQWNIFVCKSDGVCGFAFQNNSFVVWTPICACPYTISAPGNYSVECDLTVVGGGDCIVVEQSHVNLDCQYHSITGGGTALGGTGIWLHRGDRIEKLGFCRVSNFTYGMQLETPFSEVFNNTFYSNSIGIQIKSTNRDTIISYNNISYNSDKGISLAPSDNNSFYYNTVEHNGIGLYGQNSKQNFFYANSFSRNSLQGAFFEANSGSNLFFNNQFCQNTGFDFETNGKQTSSVNDSCGANRCKQGAVPNICLPNTVGNRNCTNPVPC